MGIPKLSPAGTIPHYRPISLYNVTYKLISKLIINRLRPLLDKCISQNQAAFIPGMNIQGCELLTKFPTKNLKKHNMAIKLDMGKAYDRINLDFLHCCLLKFGFSPNWIQLVMHCISSVSYSILLNGKPYGHIKGKETLYPPIYFFYALNLLLDI